MSHSHAPGQPGHTHGPQPQAGQPGVQQPAMVMRPPDPVMQAVIEDSFSQVNIALGPPENVSALCSAHSLEKCNDCDVDFINLNRLSKMLHLNPNLRCPPPPQIVSQKLSMAINNTKEEGNALFKAGQHDKAIQRYTMAINVAAQRPPWEASQLMREELSTIISNRSAAYLESGDYVGALVDAEAVITLKRGWSKGHFRKSKALMKLERYHEAKEAIELGLSFEPSNVEMGQILADIESTLKAREVTRQVKRENAPEPLPIPVPTAA